MAKSSCRLLRIRQVLEKTGLSRSALYRKIEAQEFPAQVSIGDRSVAWVESEVDEWIQERPVGRGK